MGLGLAGLGDAGLALDGVGLGGAGLEAGAGVTPIIPADGEDALGYFQSDYSPVNIETIGGSPRMDQWWKPDGSRAYTCRDGSDRIDSHDVDPPWSITSGDWTNRITITGIGSPNSLYITPDGTKMIWMTAGGSQVIQSKEMSVAFDVSTGGATSSKFLSTSSLNMRWSEDGLTMWTSRLGLIKEHAVGTAFDISTINTVATATFDILSDLPAGSPTTMGWSTDGTRLYLINNTTHELTSYTASTPFDITTLGSFSVGLDVNAPPLQAILNPRGLFYRPDNGDIHINQDQNQLRFKVFSPASASTAPTITDFSAASYSGDISASAVRPFGVFVDESGARAFIVNGSSGNDVDSYSMSVPFDLTTLSAVIASVGVVSSPIGVFLKPDGTKIFFTTFSSTIGVQEFPLSVAWDITTMGSQVVLSTAGDGATIPFGLHFSPDGLNVYTSDNGGKIYQWSLASAWDVSSPTFIGSFDFTSEIVATKGQDLSLSEDGTKMYISDLNTGVDTEIFQYSLGLPFNILTAVYDSVVLTLASRIGGSGFHMMQSQDRFYVAYNGDVGGADPEALEEFTI